MPLIITSTQYCSGSSNQCDKEKQTKVKGMRIRKNQRKWRHIMYMKVKVAQSCQILCHPMDYTVYGILQARILEWVSSVQSLSHLQLFVTPWIAAWQASMSIINSWSLLKLMPIQSVMLSNHLILCHPLLLPPSICPSIRVFSNQSVLHIRWPTDCVDHNRLWKSLQEMGIPDHLTCLLRNRYAGQEATVRTAHVLFSIVTVSTYIPTSSVEEFLFLPILSSIYYL